MKAPTFKDNKAIEIIASLAVAIILVGSLGLNFVLLMEPKNVADLCGLEKSEAVSRIGQNRFGAGAITRYSRDEYQELLSHGGKGLSSPLPVVDCDEVLHFSGGKTLIYLFIKENRVVRMAERST